MLCNSQKKELNINSRITQEWKRKKEEKVQRSGFLWYTMWKLSTLCTCDSNLNCVKISSSNLFSADPIFNCKLCLRSIRKKLISCLSPRSMYRAVVLRWKSDLSHVTNGCCWSSHEEKTRLKEKLYKEIR